MAAPGIRCGIASRRGQTVRGQMAKRSGKKPQVSRYTKAPEDASVDPTNGTSLGANRFQLRICT